MMRGVMLGLPLVLLACGPIPVAQAERECLQRARLAQQPRGEVGVGIGSDGRSRSSVKLEVSSDFIMGRDPSAVYDSCVYQKSGQVPSRPLYSFPEWKG
ncbi:MAG: hypothetical protein U0934_15895 [Pseudotabrizicola sp.]|uniref:hypothetical protein n=1 Tax=Pseudotabrizicola sp. TaxID=2939647 RepID=UPI0027172D9C|nr:hypothetical protein [Pseudotabrizicola sp.]MDO8883768.1 hypothetical protein [Pseudotabrizicola sp.]MDP2079966.1 hypothetical protein [Pseudotabrizicola sp.]MDZ7575410.1 hypothetical protein [Pseudotabrizicola sp.]